MERTKYRRGSAATEICDRLRTEILTLQLEPGSPLDETALSERFGVSRSPVREALNRLLVERLVQTLPNRSTVVAPVDLRNFPQFIQAFDVQQRFATRLAAEHRTKQDVTRLRALATAYNEYAIAGGGLAIIQANFEFHAAVGAASKNKVVQRQYGELLSETRRLLHIHIDYLDTKRDRSLLRDQHFDIVDAIEAQDIALADRLAHAHTLQFHDRFLKALHHQPDDRLMALDIWPEGAK